MADSLTACNIKEELDISCESDYSEARPFHEAQEISYNNSLYDNTIQKSAYVLPDSKSSILEYENQYTIEKKASNNNQCWKCGRCFNHRGSLSNHIKFCKIVSDLENKLKKLYQKNQKFQCPLCPYQNKRKRNVRVHVGMKHQVKEHIELKELFENIQEVTNDDNVRDPGNIEKKNNLSSSANNNQCWKCGRCFSNRGNLANHTKFCKIVSDLEIKLKKLHQKKTIFQCPLCPYQNRRETNVRVHVGMKHQVKEHIETTLENIQKVTNDDNVRDSGNTEKENNLSSSDKNKGLKYQCPICSWEHKSRYNIKTHIILAHLPSNEDYYNDEHLKIIKYSSNSIKNVEKKISFNLKENRVQKSNAERISINIPNKIKALTKIRKKKAFTGTIKHMEAFCTRCNKIKHVTDYRSECNECLWKLSYKCKVCYALYPSKEDLRIHVQRYLKNYYKCSTCDKVFSNRNNLKMHEKICVNEPSFLCNFCEYQSKIESNLQRHVMLLHLKI